MNCKYAADIVLTNGCIYTADQRETVCEAVAVKGCQILFTGSDDEVRGYIGPNTRVIDLKGRMVVPGFIDSHIHPPGLSLVEMYEVDLSHLRTVDEYIAAVRDFVRRNPEAKAVYGRGWSWGVFGGDERIKGPRKERLDAVTQELPIVLRASDGHTLWVNSRALSSNGIHKATIVPAGGVLETDPTTGELWGTLKEGAMMLIALPAYTEDHYIKAMTAFQRKMHSFGITGLLCLGSATFSSIFGAFDTMRKSGVLKLRVRGAITVSPNENLGSQFARIDALRRRFADEDVKVIGCKFFTDGVIEGGTSYLLEPYMERVGRGKHYRGEFLWDLAKLKAAFCLANQRGLQVHVHSTGDASTQNVLDALADTRAALGVGDYRNAITHLQLVAKEDIARFRELDVIASVQPYWHFKLPGWWEAVDYPLLGERAETEFPLASFFDKGVVVTSSSDYPATIVPNPLYAIETGVTRNMDNGEFYGLLDITDIEDETYLLDKRERATIGQMLKSFTINGAYALFLEHRVGSLEPGKRADMVVLDRNLLTVQPLDIDKVQAVMTFFDGELVYERK